MIAASQKESSISIQCWPIHLSGWTFPALSSHRVNLAWSCRAEAVLGTWPPPSYGLMMRHWDWGYHYGRISYCYLGCNLGLGGVHKPRLQEEGGRWSKKLTFCKPLYHRKCKWRGVGGRKKPNLVNVVCERPLRLLIIPAQNPKLFLYTPHS